MVCEQGQSRAYGVCPGAGGRPALRALGAIACHQGIRLQSNHHQLMSTDRQLAASVRHLLHTWLGVFHSILAQMNFMFFWCKSGWSTLRIKLCLPTSVFNTHNTLVSATDRSNMTGRVWITVNLIKQIIFFGREKKSKDSNYNSLCICSRSY